MGVVPGAPDWVFIRQNDAFAIFIELKTAVGSLSPNQIRFKDWCDSLNVLYYVCRSWKEVKKILLFHKMMR
jgi:hypothetical protein